ncbi:MAG: exopolysaccharide transport family protein [Hyphomicrobium sp.]|nr:exopolysaccharide transport family protein [Hyphomicrobium sp.]
MTRANPDDIELAPIGRAVVRSIPKLLVLSAVTAGATYFALSMVAPRYQSEAQLEVSAKGVTNPFAGPARDGAGPDTVSVRMDKEAINTHVRALMAPELGERLAFEMKLADRREFNPALGPADQMSGLLRMIGIGVPRDGESERDRVMASFNDRLEVYSPKESRSIAIRFTSMDAELAARVANGLAESYRESLAAKTISETDEVQKALEPKVAKLRTEVATADAAIEKFRAEANIFKGGREQQSLTEQQLAELTQELTRVEAAKSEADARVRSARELAGKGSADVLPEVQRSPLLQNIVQERVRLERQISELSATLLPGHPRMRQLQSELSGLKKQIADEIAKVVAGLEKEAKVTALRHEEIKKSIATVKSRIVDTGPDQVKLRQLEDEAKSKRQELERLVAQFEANRAKSDSRTVPVEAQIVSSARAASVPVYPKKGAYAGLVAFATLLFGLAIVVTGALLRGARKSEDEIDATGRAPRETRPAVVTKPTVANTATPVPKMPAAQKVEPILARPVAVVAETKAVTDAAPAAIQGAVQGPARDLGQDEGAVARVASIATLASRIIGNASGGNGYRTMIAGETGLVPVSAIAIEAAKELSECGYSVVLIDWSPEGKGVADSAGIEAGAGMGELLEGGATFVDVVRRLSDSDAHIIAAGSLKLLPGTRLDPDRINLVLDALDEAYDHIVIAGRYEPTRVLFETIEGRIDTGVLVGETVRFGADAGDKAGMYLGFDVADIDVVRYERAQPVTVPHERLARAVGR